MAMILGYFCYCVCPHNIDQNLQHRLITTIRFQGMLPIQKYHTGTDTIISYCMDSLGYIPWYFHVGNASSSCSLWDFIFICKIHVHGMSLPYLHSTTCRMPFMKHLGLGYTNFLIFLLLFWGQGPHVHVYRKILGLLCSRSIWLFTLLFFFKEISS